MAWDEEEFCKESFGKYLKEHLCASNIKWQRMPTGQHPPDFYLTLGHTTFAVEVTRTEVMENAVITGQVRELTYANSHTRLVRQVEEAAQIDGTLNGTYVITFPGPLTTSRFNKVKRHVLKELLTYIERTQHVSNSPREAVFHQDLPVCWIEKLHNQSDKVCEEFTSLEWVESPEVTNRVCQMLQDAVTKKKQKFEEKGESAPKVLLLLSTYDFADPAMYKNCIHRIQSLDFFHSIFVVWRDGRVFPLFSTNSF